MNSTQQKVVPAGKKKRSRSEHFILGLLSGQLVAYGLTYGVPIVFDLIVAYHKWRATLY